MGLITCVGLITETGEPDDTLPERLTVARTCSMGHWAFLELGLTDEVTCCLATLMPVRG